MEEISKETIITKGTHVEPVVNTTTKNTSVKSVATSTQTIEYLIYFLFGALEILLAFRFIFKLTGASAASAFVRMIYDITGLFILPFEGIFRRSFTEGVETTAVFEPATLVAILVYALVTWGIVQLARILSGEHPAEDIV